MPNNPNSMNSNAAPPASPGTIDALPMVFFGQTSDEFNQTKWLVKVKYFSTMIFCYIFLVQFVEEIMKHMNRSKNYLVVIYFMQLVSILGSRVLVFVLYVVSVLCQLDRRTLLFAPIFIY